MSKVVRSAMHRYTGAEGHPAYPDGHQLPHAVALQRPVIVRELRKHLLLAWPSSRSTVPRSSIGSLQSEDLRRVVDPCDWFQLELQRTEAR